MGYTVLTPPPLPDHVRSDCHGPPAPDVVRLVPPTTVTFGSSEGGITTPLYAPLSPDAWKNDCPCAINCLKICSVVALMPKPHEELSCWPRLSVAIRFRISLG